VSTEAGVPQQYPRGRKRRSGPAGLDEAQGACGPNQHPLHAARTTALRQPQPVPAPKQTTSRRQAGTAAARS